MTDAPSDLPEGAPKAAPTTPKRRLLLVDDEENILRALRRAFESDYEVHEARDGQGALDVARAIQPDVIISDQSMPTMTGVELLAKLKEEFPDAIRVLTTGYTDYGSLVDAVNAAQVHHYFEKPFHTVDLKTVVDSLLRTNALEQERVVLLRQLQTSVEQLESANGQLATKEAELQRLLQVRTHELSDSNLKLQASNYQLGMANQQLREQAVRDGLTGLYNFRHLMEHASIELARAQRYRRCFCVIFLDIDGFKSINDTFGHLLGDKVLCAIANVLRPDNEGLRRSDFAARYGGEEFCILLPETHLQGGTVKANRLCTTIAKFDWQTIAPTLPQVTVSVGVAAFPDHGETLEKLIASADAAQYEAKRGGKNRVVVAT